ncbi:MAG: LUD domain-containing protein [Acidobacteria bacterium]|nr:LUD domain-containing protein [Acidobacteriota bacterium]
MSLDIESATVRANTQHFNKSRYRAAANFPDYDALKDEARAIKDKSIANLPDLIQTLKNSIRARNGHVFVANTAADACRYVLDVCRWRAAKMVVKGKSMTSEEVHLNHALEADGIEVVESDLAEFILQQADEQPSHILAPALHYSRERITKLFKRKFETELPLDTGEELTFFARQILREKFLHADVGVTGANLIAADTGTLMLVESEGNIRLSSFAPPVHIAIAGIEKIVPTREEMAPFLELLSMSATGQTMSVYTSFISPPLADPPFAMPSKPLKPREFHLVLIDNGRLKMRDDPVFHEALNCIRCGACLNSCANFQTVGGHAFGGETYSGGIGGSWEAFTSKLENARFSELCTGCTRCVQNCPVRIDIPWLNANLGNRLNQLDPSSTTKSLIGSMTHADPVDRTAPISKIFFGNYDYFAKWGMRFPSMANSIDAGRAPSTRADTSDEGNTSFPRVMMEKWFNVDRRRTLPPFPKHTFVQEADSIEPPSSKGREIKVVIFADAFTNYGMTSRGLATLKVLRELGADVVVSKCVPEGRAAMSQGMIATAKQHARAATRELDPHVSDGRDIVVVEPSSLSMFRRDFARLLDSKERYERFRARAFEPVEYVEKILKKIGRKPADVFDISKSKVGHRLFFHAHCQQKTIGAADATVRLLTEIGFDVAMSNVECCGMAGSFGYKKDFYDLSLAVGADLFGQVVQQDREGGARQLIASGTSCTEQLHAGFERKILHPMELLVTLIEPQKESDKAAKDAEDAEVEADLDALKRSKREASNS